MKKSLFLLVFLLPLVACVSKKSAPQLQDDRDSLAMVVAAKDSIIGDVFSSLNDIAENLSVIKTRENLISTKVDGGEIRKEATVQISQDIAQIDQLLQTNRQTIARLEQSAAQLRKANIKIAGLEKLIKQLEGQVETQDREIASLRKTLAQRNIEIADLHTKVEAYGSAVNELAADKNKLEGEVKTTTDLLNVAYYIIGAEKDLIAKEIVYKSGFIGRTLKINENRSLDSFIQVDARTFDEVIIGKKKATLVSSHPEGSYEFVMNGDNIYSSLIIKDKNKFWEYSKVLVISYK